MIAVVLLAVSAPLAAGDSLYGIVRTAGSGDVIPGVQVSVRGYPEAVVSDPEGRYVLHDLPNGRLELRLERLGFEPLTVSVTLAADGVARVDVDLALAPVALPPVTVRPPDAPIPLRPADQNEIGAVHLTRDVVGHDPLIDAADVFGAVATAPFISGRDELNPSLHVRGGSGDQNLVFLDGIPWRGPRPLGGIAGLMPNGAVAAVDVHTAAPPARYGNALSSMIIVHPHVADRFASEGRLDGSMIEQTVGGPLPLRGGSILVSGRWTYRSVFNAPEGGESDNGFRDGVGRLSVPAGAGSLDLYYIDGRNQLVFLATPESSSSAMNRFRSAGSLAGAVWTRPLGANRVLHARAWFSRVTGGAAWGSWTMTSGLRDVGLSAEYAADRTEVGLTLTKTVTTYRARDSLAGLALDGAPVVATAFASRLWMPTSPWTVSTGVRLNATSTWGIQIEPRVWTRMALGHGVSASVGYARIYQYVQSARNEESVLDAVLGMDLPVAAGAGGLPPARSDQVTAALEARVGAEASIVVEAYARRLSGQALVGSATRLPFADRGIGVGGGSTRGIDATVAYQGRLLDIRAQVGLLGTTRTAGAMRYRPSDDSKRATVGVAYRAGHLAVVRASATLGNGRPATMLQDGLQLDPYAPMDGGGALTGSPMGVPGTLNTARLPAYARVDLAFSRDWGLQGGGSGARINTSFTVTNLLDRRNVLAYVAAPDGARPVFLVPRTISLRVRWALGDWP